ncbi:MAG: indole-3-glycerol-phosphate synthase [Coriobacteriia bacterium]|nr:indole-3-glycerol-phosphate synthase [Coriobacteriia bacterium]
MTVAAQKRGAPQRRSALLAAIAAKNAEGLIAVIPDIKCISPKEGNLLSGRNPVEVARQLVSYGAPILSVVTEGVHFGGSTSLLADIVHAVPVPVLRKDFITTSEQLEETKSLGAQAVLLICAMLDEHRLQTLYALALELGLEPLVEVCALDEMKLAKDLGARLIGINNKNIASLEKDEGGPTRTAELAPHAPKGAVVISESGIHTPADARIAALAGAHAVLVGTALWRAPNMQTLFDGLVIERGGSSCGQ